jgi:hypothetical protein
VIPLTFTDDLARASNDGKDSNYGYPTCRVLLIGSSILLSEVPADVNRRKNTEPALLEALPEMMMSLAPN